MKKLFMKISSFICGCAVFASAFISLPSLYVRADENRTITIDGDASDWDGIEGYFVDHVPVGSACVSEVKFAYSDDGERLYVCYVGTTPGRGMTDFLNYNIVASKGGISRSIPVGNFQYYPPGCEVKYTNYATNWGVPGLYEVEASFPVSEFGGDNFEISLKGKTATSDIVKSEDINKVSDYSGPGSNDEPPIYGGITIDGTFSDWAAISKTGISCPNAGHPECIKECASVFDGDYVYIYIKDGKGGNAVNAGTHSTGLFSVVTDLGRNLVFGLNPDGTVNGVEGIESFHFGNEWEIGIPKAALPKYEQTLSFGLYQCEPFITGITNMQDDNGNAGSFDGITYDGLYGDWNDYPHTLIQYATAGTNEILADGEQAIYSDNGMLYGHVVSAMVRHTSQNGTEMTRAITIRFNNDSNMEFQPRLVAVDQDGNINWNPNFDAMEPGKKYEYYLADITDWNNARNINDVDLNAQHSKMYGKITISVGGTGKADEAEYYLDLKMIAEKFGVDADELKVIESQFGRIGREWASCAGTSTGPVLGIVLCLGAIGVPMLIKRKKENDLQDVLTEERV